VSEGDTNLRAGARWPSLCVHRHTDRHADDHKTLQPTARR